MSSVIKECQRKFFAENPIFKLALGLCPTLAVTTSIENAVGLGLASTAVLIFSGLFISLLRNLIPDVVRIPSFILIIATFVTMIDLIIQGYFPKISEQLSIFVPLIVVNCLILGRAEVFASKEPPNKAVRDGLIMGISFTLSLMLIGAVREILGTGMIKWGTVVLLTLPIPSITTMILAPGAFLSVGLLLALFKFIADKRGAHE